MRKLTSYELKELIQEHSAEAVHVDFKQKWKGKEDNAKLIHDILCMSNANHNGDRFLLFGVNDSAEIVGVHDDPNRKDNAKLPEFLRKCNFNRLPEIIIYTVSIDGKDIDVVQIGNTAYKPYFLTKEYEQNKKQLRAGSIYSRNGSSNTPIDSTASETETETMWRERFGLDQTPLLRIKKYLSDINNWTYDSYGNAFYNPFPEFTIRTDAERSADLDQDQEWTRGEIGYHYTSGNAAYLSEILYYQTCLKEIHSVVFDGSKKTVVTPEWTAVGAGRFYYYLKDSVDYAFHIHNVLHGRGRDDSLELRYGSTEKHNGNYSIPRFEHAEELQLFLNSLEKPFEEPATDSSTQNELWYDLVKEYNNWRSNN